jgi:hypothetical protein
MLLRRSWQAPQFAMTAGRAVLLGVILQKAKPEAGELVVD